MSASKKAPKTSPPRNEKASKAAAPQAPTDEKAKRVRLTYDVSRRKGVRITRDVTLALLKQDNPHRPGSRVHTAFSLYRNGMTVGEFMDAGGLVGDIRQHVDTGYIELTAPEPKEPAQAPKAQGQGQ